ncbi:MAG: putative bacteriocin export ABC transporter [Clostridiales bacterium]|nr:putative bacteriocin export ABC transporter [Clostridiales bacterium]
MSVIKLINICKKYDDKVIFDNLNLEINEGEFVSIVGESGAGKSTLLNIIGLLETADSGDIIIHNVKNPKLQKRSGSILLRNNIAYLFQNYGLIDNETVLENLMISLRFRQMTKKEKIKEAQKALENVGLSGLGKKKVYKLSGGEQQRVALAKIMLKPCDIILADEPTGSLDNDNKHAVLNILKKFNEEGKTVIVVTHDSVVAECAKRSVKI